MTGRRPEDEERSDLAAECALGVLTGAERQRVLALLASDPEFRAEVELWTGRLAPLLDEVDPVAPPKRLWNSITATVAGDDSRGRVVMLRRRLNVWRGVATAMTALAACLAIILVARPLPPAPSPVQQTAAPPLVAMLGNDQKTVTLVASWDPAGRQLVLAVAGDMPPDDRHSRELWVIPSDGQPRSLGTMGNSRAMHMRLEQALAELMRQGATIAISIEPRGGSPTGAPTGPVVASGALETT